MNMALLKEGFFIMVIGMGTVFVFLAIMIWFMNITEVILRHVAKYFPEGDLEAKNTKKKPKSNNDEIALAIVCAINTQKGVR